MLHRLGSPDVVLTYAGGTITAGALIAQAEDVWLNGTGAEQTELAALLDAFNNDDAVEFVEWDPCPLPAF